MPMNKELLKIEEQLKKTEGEDKEGLFSIAEEIFQKQMNNVGMISYVELFQEATLGMGQYHYAVKNGIPIDENVEAVYKKLMAFVGELPSILGNFEERIIDIKELRKEIVQYIRLLSAYYTECSYIDEIVADKLAGKRLEEKETQRIDLQVFYKDVGRYLSVDMEKIPYKMSRILAVLPFRMTKQLFLERVEQILRRVKKDSPAKGWSTILQRYREHFDGSVYPLYGQGFRKIYETIEGLKKTDYRNLSEEELRKMQKESGFILDHAAGLVQTFQSYCSMTNRILVLHEIKFKDFEKVLEGELVIPDIYKRFTEVKRLVEGKETTAATVEKLEALYEVCRGKAKDLYENAKDFSEVFHRCIAKLEGELNPLLKNYLEISKGVMAIANDFEHEEYDWLIGNVSSSGGCSNQEDSVEAFIHFLQKNIQEMSTDFRRARMRKFLSVLPMPFPSPEEFFDYLKSSLEFNTTAGEKAWVAAKVYQVIENDMEKTK
ncbi:hypothetical protein [Thermotalea metallivorans]|uniref:Uncharacterized protein n=1 Tax=Thermotalea metallivorans TaxID=520762 RepID=A0A140L100_9FIRM|nr:hypothetical protein [Thermotalea metallivorans]KXG74225.1 hypothetical protein AN619_25430 [Thermotalea metallivorans]